jgi:triphosphoribosyl-dephospho-CoA synthase
LEPVLARLDLADSHAVYQAIALTQPGGLGRVDRGDVTTGPTGTLREMMALAAGHDAIAAEYAQGFPRVLQVGVPSLRRWQAHGPATAVVATQLELLTRCPDSLIARKCGAPLADEASQRASEVLAAGWPHTPTGQVALAEFDRWLRADGHRRNPGTTADLVGASLFAFFRDDQPGWPPCPLAELSDA